jgi:hypothetical protein
MFRKCDIVWSFQTMLLRLVWALFGVTHFDARKSYTKQHFRIQTGRISNWTYSKTDVYRGTIPPSAVPSNSTQCAFGEACHCCVSCVGATRYGTTYMSTFRVRGWLDPMKSYLRHIIIAMAEFHTEVQTQLEYCLDIYTAGSGVKHIHNQVIGILYCYFNIFIYS